MSLLTIIQDVCDEVGITRPTAVMSSSDQTIRQLVALSNRSGKFLAQRMAWEELQVSATHTTLAAELQGDVNTILPGFNWYVYRSMWNRNNRMPVWGPLFPEEWQFLKASNITGPFPEFRIQGGNLYFLPAPSAGQTIGLEYISKRWCESSGGTGQEKWAADTDTGILSEDLLSADLVWRFKASKGFEYAEDKQTAEILINNAMARSGSRRVLKMSANGGYENESFGLRVPDGSWYQ